MFKLLKFGLFVTATVIAGYFLLSISLGGKTLYQHLYGIFETDEAQTLKNEIGKKVDDATEDLKDKASALARDRLREKLDDAEKPSEKRPDTEDRKSLDALISTKNRQDDSLDDRRGLKQLIESKIKENR